MPRRLLAAVVSLALLLTLAPTRATAHGSSDGIRESLDAVVANGSPGVLVHADDGQTSWTMTSGVADLQTRQPVPRTARFRAASLTKSVVATVVLQLVEQRRLRLDEPVGDMLPGLLSDGDHITVRQLLNHTSGLGDYIDDPEFSDPLVYGKRTFRPEQLVEYAERGGPVGEPGGSFHYSNAGYIVLGMLVERVTGHPLSVEVARRVFRPAGMTHSYLPTTDPLILGPHATGYYLPSAGADLVPVTYLNPSFAWAAYGMVTDARDLNRLFRALFSGRLLGPRALREMHRGVPPAQAPVFPLYGLGLEALQLTCGRVWGGTGAIPGYETMSFADAHGTSAITVSMNVHRSDPDAGLMLLPAIDVVNRSLCGEPYHLPPGSTGQAVRSPRV